MLCAGYIRLCFGFSVWFDFVSLSLCEIWWWFDNENENDEEDDGDGVKDGEEVKEEDKEEFKKKYNTQEIVTDPNRWHNLDLILRSVLSFPDTNGK